MACNALFIYQRAAVSQRLKIAVNFIAFQLGWFSCVLMAARNTPEIGIAITLLLVVFHLLLDRNRINTVLLLIIVTIIGSAWDSLLTQQAVLIYNSGMFVEYLAPSWIMAMWLIFATTLTVTFRWLYGRYWLAMILGAVFGPLAYLGGSALGAVIIPGMLTAMVSLSIGWALLMPLLIRLAELFQEYEPLKGEDDAYI